MELIEKDVEVAARVSLRPQTPKAILRPSMSLRSTPNVLRGVAPRTPAGSLRHRSASFQLFSTHSEERKKPYQPNQLVGSSERACSLLRIVVRPKCLARMCTAFGASVTCALVRHFRFATLSDSMKSRLIRVTYGDILLGALSLIRFFVHASGG